MGGCTSFPLEPLTPRCQREHCRRRLYEEDVYPICLTCRKVEAIYDPLVDIWQSGYENHGVLAVYEYKRQVFAPLRTLLALGHKAIKPSQAQVLREACFGSVLLPSDPDNWNDYFTLLRTFQLEADWAYLLQYVPHLAVPIARELGIVN